MTSAVDAPEHAWGRRRAAGSHRHRAVSDSRASCDSTRCRDSFGHRCRAASAPAPRGPAEASRHRRRPAVCRACRAWRSRSTRSRRAPAPRRPTPVRGPPTASTAAASRVVRRRRGSIASIIGLRRSLRRRPRIPRRSDAGRSRGWPVSLLTDGLPPNAPWPRNAAVTSAKTTFTPCAAAASTVAEIIAFMVATPRLTPSATPGASGNGYPVTTMRAFGAMVLIAAIVSASSGPSSVVRYVFAASSAAPHCREFGSGTHAASRPGRSSPLAPTVSVTSVVPRLSCAETGRSTSSKSAPVHAALRRNVDARLRVEQTGVPERALQAHVVGRRPCPARRRTNRRGHVLRDRWRRRGGRRARGPDGNCEQRDDGRDNDGATLPECGGHEPKVDLNVSDPQYPRTGGTIRHRGSPLALDMTESLRWGILATGGIARLFTGDLEGQRLRRAGRRLAFAVERRRVRGRVRGADVVRQLRGSRRRPRCRRHLHRVAAPAPRGPCDAGARSRQARAHREAVRPEHRHRHARSPTSPPHAGCWPSRRCGPGTCRTRSASTRLIDDSGALGEVRYLSSPITPRNCPTTRRTASMRSNSAAVRCSTSASIRCPSRGISSAHRRPCRPRPRSRQPAPTRRSPTIFGYEGNRMASSLSASDTRGLNTAVVLGSEARIEIDSVWYTADPVGLSRTM